MIFDSRRSTVHARRGMVSTSQPLASMAGLRMLMEGGNAVDAAVAAAATLNVVEPVYTGAGGDLFAMVWLDSEKQVRALNSSGRASQAASIDELRSKGFTEMPYLSPYAVTVPGALAGWDTLLKTYGSMPLSHVLGQPSDMPRTATPSPTLYPGSGITGCPSCPCTHRAQSLCLTGGPRDMAR